MIADASEYVWLRVCNIHRITLPFNSFASRGALASATGDPVDDLYATNTSIPLTQGAGLRQLYKFGLYSYCAYVNNTEGNCSNHTTALQLQPYDIVLADMPTRYPSLTRAFVPDQYTFTNSHYLGEFSRAAYYLLLMGSICAALAMLT